MASVKLTPGMPGYKKKNPLQAAIQRRMQARKATEATKPQKPGVGGGRGSSPYKAEEEDDTVTKRKNAGY